MLAVGSAERQAKSRFGASFGAVQNATFGTMGCQPRARSVLRCHGVLVLRQVPLTAAVQDESQLQEDTSTLAVGSAERQAKSRLELVSRQFRKRRLALWAAGRGPIRPSLPWCFGAATGSSHRSCAGRKPAARGHKHAGSWQCRKAGKVKVWSWFLGRFRMRCLALWAAGRGQIRPSLPWCFGAATLGWADVLVST